MLYTDHKIKIIQILLKKETFLNIKYQLNLIMSNFPDFDIFKSL
ncbi:hypothetical protein FDUTEX481_07296 [Tolypothrix sp. PCC 7601]|nr:hypothetical protein FDUTEX481_07296 [Tolypothrix sp. PCC 7601]